MPSLLLLSKAFTETTFGFFCSSNWDGFANSQGLLPFAKREVDRSLKELNVEKPREYDELMKEMKHRLENNKVEAV